jgi:hypothetical protein
MKNIEITKHSKTPKKCHHPILTNNISRESRCKFLNLEITTHSHGRLLAHLPHEPLANIAHRAKHRLDLAGCESRRQFRPQLLPLGIVEIEQMRRYRIVPLVVERAAVDEVSGIAHEDILDELEVGAEDDRLQVVEEPDKWRQLSLVNLVDLAVQLELVELRADALEIAVWEFGWHEWDVAVRPVAETVLDERDDGDDGQRGDN